MSSNKPLTWFVVATSLLFLASACGKEEGLKITRWSPKVGNLSGGEPVTFYGTGFQKGGATSIDVYFGDKKATVRHFVDTELVVDPPSGKAGQTVDVDIVFGSEGKLTIKDAYKYVEPDNRSFLLEEALTGEAKEQEEKKNKEPAAP